MKVTTDACLFGAWGANLIATLKEEPKNILDIGTGTGLLSLMLAQTTKKSRFDAIEINKEAFLEAKDNFANAPWPKRINPIHSSLQAFKPSKTYDLIICNPPFYANSLKGKSKHKNQALHELTLTLEELLKQSVKLLSKKGSLLILYPEKEMNSALIEAKSHNLYPNAQVLVRNKLNDKIFRKMVAFRFTKGHTTESEIIIRDDSAKYTKNFWNLLNPYYLEYNDPKHP